jgi:FKBP-type peptidyl-prolyl cis-trans isomerase
MTRFSVKLLFILSFCFLFSSCKKQAPQLPSNKGVKVDHNEESLLKINHQLTIKEDALLKKYAESKKTFKKNELGFWYKIIQSGTGSGIKDSSVCKISCKLRLLSGKIIKTEKSRFIIGKKQQAVGLEEGVKLMRKGDSAVFIIPWYLGFGMKGDEPLIPPYTSIIYEIKLLN